MKYYLIDLENVGNKGLAGTDFLDQNARLVIFYSPAAGQISKFCCDLLRKGRAEVFWQAVNIRTKNALDFELAVYVGGLLQNENTESVFIISMDTGYRAVLEAGNKKKAGKIRQYRSVLEAWYMESHLPDPAPKDTMIGIKSVRKLLDQKKQVEYIAEKLELNPQELEALLSDCESDIRRLYLGMLHTFGREKGLCAYRQIQANGLGPFTKIKGTSRNAV